MNASERELLIETVDRLFAELAGAGDFGSGWQRIEEIGVGSLLVPESAGGFGGEFFDAALVAHRVALHSVALPIVESMLARRLLAAAGIDTVGGAISIAAESHGALDGKAGGPGARYTGILRNVPWGRDVGHVLLAVPQCERVLLVCLARTAASRLTPATNMAGEARDTLEFSNAAVLASAPLESAATLPGLGALLRTAEIGGALDSLLKQCVTHASGRSQFGRPLSQFQVIQHQIALLAEECAAVNAAALAAARAADRGAAQFAIAAAKLRANRAVGSATSIAHQVHGAIGCTSEHALHHATQRLWSWRSEFGNDRHWALELGRRIAGAGADAFWPALTAGGDRGAEAAREN